MHYLVTGGAGFIGSHLVEALLAAGHKVRVLDDLSTGRENNIPAGAEFQHGDITHPDDVRAALQGVEGCFHLAAIASVTRSVEQWANTHRVNQYGSVVVFEQAASQSIPVVYASSAAIYGDNDALPLVEGVMPAPLSPYGLDKLACEWQAAVGRLSHQLNSFGVRFFNIYGPRQDPHSPYAGVISIFMERLRQQKALTIFGDGKQSRDFVYVKDAVAFVIAAMAYLYKQPQPANEVVNVCRNQAVTILDIAETLQRITLQELPIHFEAERAGDIRHSRGEAAKAQQLLGATTKTSLQEGLEQTWRSFCES